MHLYYRPHPKEWGRYCFHRRLSVHTCGWGGGGYPHLADGGGYPILPDGGYPILPNRGYPILPDRGDTPSFLTGDRATQRVLATRRAVCLLRSRRTTFWSYSYTSKENNSFQIKSAMEEIPYLVKNERNITTLQPSDSLIQPRVISLKGESKIRIKGADRLEVEVVENLIWAAARDGDGFCLDEFCPEDGHFLHKFILEPTVVLATDHCGNVIGAAICGISGVTRVPGSLFAAYFIVQKSFRKKGVATALLDVVYELSMQNSCDMLLFDVFSNNLPAIEWLYKQGFVTTGSVPHCGYVANRGYTSTLLMYKQLYETTSKI